MEFAYCWLAISHSVEGRARVMLDHARKKTIGFPDLLGEGALAEYSKSLCGSPADKKHFQTAPLKG
ncbi:hypothetical protein CPSG_00261 [Coccidioides posadasii str. Silveira]|uniref:Uncharacterized protein n=1 Tax=Coccidioides posadasii (strain RMSCC 757 / Silveira) TaxID=443226 RepID=E9CR27_COCPS|nr:hypothetical protein CPSG_00261 [Coccidioides posadasii str. Silveira]